MLPSAALLLASLVAASALSVQHTAALHRARGGGRNLHAGLLDMFMQKSYEAPVVMGDESIMSQKARGTARRGAARGCARTHVCLHARPPLLTGARDFGDSRAEELALELPGGAHRAHLQLQPTFHEPSTNLQVELADQICNFNRHYAENSGYWERSTTFLQEEAQPTGELQFYDSNSGKPLFSAPRNRSWEQFVRESKSHGWPSFRDDEV